MEIEIVVTDNLVSRTTSNRWGTMHLQPMLSALDNRFTIGTNHFLEAERNADMIRFLICIWKLWPWPTRETHTNYFFLVQSWCILQSHFTAQFQVTLVAAISEPLCVIYWVRFHFHMRPTSQLLAPKVFYVLTQYLQILQGKTPECFESHWSP